MTDHELCKHCDRPIANEEDWDTIPEGEGEHLCWEPGLLQCMEKEVDWRQRALNAEAEVKRLRTSSSTTTGKARPEIEAWVAAASDEQRIVLDEFIGVLEGTHDSGSIWIALKACVKASSMWYIRHCLDLMDHP